MKILNDISFIHVAVLLFCLLLSVAIAAERKHFHHEHSMKHDHPMMEDEQPVYIKRVNKEGACPTMDLDSIGICQEDCTGDSDCEDSLKCCRNGCGKTCQKPDEENECSIRCNKMYDPVCGSDGVTYGNECVLRDLKCRRQQTFIEVKHEGECHAPRKEGPCDRMYQSAMAMKEPHMVGHTIPQCDQHGFFKPMQCSGSTGACWCVSRDGDHLQTKEDLWIRTDEDCMKALYKM